MDIIDVNEYDGTYSIYVRSEEMKTTIYKGLAITNDLKAIRKNRIGQRIWNRVLLKFARKLMK